MPCAISEDGKLVICLRDNKRITHYFTDDMRLAVHHDNLWYDPDVVAKRKKHERIDYFRKRVKKKLGFMPVKYETWWKKFALPRLKGEAPDA